jgi:4-hydroxy-tetrahydrodipicolinate reductase
MSNISVAVHGALGKMGREIISAVSRDAELNLMGAVDIKAKASSITLDNGQSVPLYTSVEPLLSGVKPDVIVDFSLAAAAMAMIRTVAKAGVNLVTGTTGFSAEDMEEIGHLAKDNKVGIIISSNFALGAVIMMHLAKIAAKYFNSAEIIEMHHDEKADAPSGTALATARGMIEAREGKPFNYPVTKKESLSGTRGGQFEGIAIHSVRLPGFVASQEIIFGLQGQTLKIRHDAINRECYMPGVIMAIKEVMKQRGSVHNLDDLLQTGGK